MKRKKRAKKSVISLNSRIKEHEEKLEAAKKEGKIELSNYYKDELEHLKDYLKKKKKIADK